MIDRAICNFRRIGFYIYQKKRPIILALIGYFIAMHLLYGGISKILHWKQYMHLQTNMGLTMRTMNLSNRKQSVAFDIHFEHPDYGHTGEVWEFGTSSSTEDDSLTTVAIGLGITSKGLGSRANLTSIAEQFQIFYRFMPSFCATVTAGKYKYSFYLGYDHNDELFTDTEFREDFSRAFYASIKNLCPAGLATSLHLIQCDHFGKPVWAQNDAMMEAYLDDVSYYYRVNDDTNLTSSGWTDIFINTLANNDPKNVGVVGPKHAGGNIGILTYDFVHRTHIDILGYYYPRLFTDWWGDNWISEVYGRNRTKKIRNVTLAHTREMGRRYEIHKAIFQKLNSQVTIDKKLIARYVAYISSNVSSVVPAGDLIISMSLWGKQPRYTWGAIRNAQLAPIIFPGWRLRIYTLDPNCSSCPNRAELLVPHRILTKLAQLNVQIIFLNNSSLAQINPKTWRYLVMDDPQVKYFLIRDTDLRLCKRDAHVVESWKMENDNETSLLCIRDHPMHSKHPVVDGLWGGRAHVIRTMLNTSVESMLLQYNFSYNSIQNNISDANSTEELKISFLLNTLWPVFSNSSKCYDSVSCKNWPRSVPIAHNRKHFEYLGQKYDEHQELRVTPKKIKIESKNKDCAPIRTELPLQRTV